MASKKQPQPTDRKKSVLKKGPSAKKHETTMEDVTEIDDEIDFESLVLKEYNKLHRQYRLMENNRHLIAEEGKSLKQKEHYVEILENQRNELQTTLKNAESLPFRRVDKKNIRTILDILEYCDNTNLDIVWCIRNIEEMEGNVSKITKRLIQQKLKMQSIYGQSMTVAQAEKRKRLLEDRLYYYTTRYDSKISQNKTLREEINMMLKVRGLFYERLVTIKKLSGYVRSTMGEYVYLATHAYENRDDFITKITQLREKNDKDSKQHVSDIRDQNRVLAHDIKLHSFTSFKNSRRDVLESVDQRVDRINTNKLIQMDEILTSHGKSFKQVLALSNHNSMDALVKDYNDREQSNFTKFKYINDLDDEVKTLQNDTISMGKDIETMHKESVRLDKSRREEIEAELEQVVENNAKLKSIKEKDATSKENFDQLIHQLTDIYTVGECGNTSIASLLGTGGVKNEVNEYNAQFSLKAIEKRIGDLMDMVKELEIRKWEEIDSKAGHHQMHNTQRHPQYHKHAPQAKQTMVKRINVGGPFMPDILMTRHVDGEDEDEESLADRSAKPLGLAQLKDKIYDKLKRQAETRLKMSLLEINPNEKHDDNSETEEEQQHRTSELINHEYSMLHQRLV